MISNQATTIIYGIANGVVTPVGSLNYNNAGQLILTPTGGTSGGGTTGVTTPFASIAAAKAMASASVGVGNLIQIVGAVNPNQLSTYQLQNGTPTQASPYQFQPSDNAALVYTLVS